jgi:ketosteroid isomerase-like protein
MWARPRDTAQAMSAATPVRQKIRFHDRPRRSLDERITARFPAIARYTAARVAHLPPSSRVRQRFLAQAVSRGFAATKRGDLEFLLAAFYDPDVEWHGTVGGLDEGSLRRGHQAVMRGFDDYFAAWERLDLRPEEIIDTGDELIVFVHEVARGKESGVVLETDTATISTLREGMVVRVRGFMDRSQALEAVGLSE